MAFDDDIRDAAIKALLSGGTSGALFGAGSALIGRKNLLKSAGVGGLAGAALAGGGTYLGSKIMGAPKDDDPSAYTERAGLGGAVAGGGIGAVLGGLAGGGAIEPEVFPEVARGGLSYLSKLRGGRGAALGALLGGLGLGSVAAYKAGDEGMQLDFLRNQMKQHKKRQMGG